MPCEPKNRPHLLQIIGYSLLLIFGIAFLVTVVFGQAGQATRTAKSDPTGVACTSNSPILEYNNGQYTCVSSAYALTSVKRAEYAIASLPTCNAAYKGQTVNVTDGNKGQRTCRNTTGSTYAWVDDDPVFRPERFGAVVNDGVSDAVALQAAFNAAGAVNGVVRLESGTYVSGAELTVPTGISIIGSGINTTIIQYTAATGSLLRAQNYAIAQAANRFENFAIIATGAAMNANTVGLNMSAIGSSMVKNFRSTDFGTNILNDGYMSGSYVPSFYNNFYDVEVLNGAAGRGYGVGIAIKNRANSNSFYRPRFSYMLRPISIGDGVEEGPNQLFFSNPVIEGWEEYAVYVRKALGVRFEVGRYEGDYTKFKVHDSVTDVQGVSIICPHFEGAGTNIDTLNPMVRIEGGCFNYYSSQSVGTSSVATNLVSNGGFEGWPPDLSTPVLGWTNINGTNWAHGTTYHSRTSTNKQGSYALILGNGADLGVGVASAAVDVNPAVPYTLDWWSRATGTTGGYRLGLRLFNSAGAQITTGWDGKLGVGNSTLTYDVTYNAWVLGGNVTHSVADTWYRYTYAMQLPSTTKTVQIGFIRTAVAATNVLLDGVQFSPGEASLAFVSRALPDSGNQTFFGRLTAPKLYLQGVGATSATEALRIENSTGSYNVVVQDDFSTRLRGVQIGSGLFSSTIPSNGLLVEGRANIGAATGSVAQLHVVAPAGAISYLDGAVSSTSVGSFAGIFLSNTNGTTNNRAGIGFSASSGGAAAGSLELRFTDRSNNYGDLSFVTRSPSGYTEKLGIASDGTITLNGGTATFAANGKLSLDQTVTAGGTTGDRTINKPSGTVNIAAGGTSVTITNSLISSSSILSVIARTNDATCAVKNYVAAAGTVTITMTAACTGETSVGFIVIN